MRKLISLQKATIIVVALAAVGTSLVLAASASGQTPTPAIASRVTAVPKGVSDVESTLLAFPFTGGHQRYVDVGKKGFSPGDLFLTTDAPILDNATGQQIGSSDSVELIVSRRHEGTVTSQGTLRLPGGHLNVDGVGRHTDHPFRVSVTGGTGRYIGVSGQLTIIREDNQRKVTIANLELIPPPAS